MYINNKMDIVIIILIIILTAVPGGLLFYVWNNPNCSKCVPDCSTCVSDCSKCITDRWGVTKGVKLSADNTSFNVSAKTMPEIFGLITYNGYDTLFFDGKSTAYGCKGADCKIEKSENDQIYKYKGELCKLK